MKLTTHIQVVPKLRNCGCIHPLHHTPSWHTAQLVNHRDNNFFIITSTTIVIIIITVIIITISEWIDILVMLSTYIFETFISKLAVLTFAIRDKEISNQFHCGATVCGSMGCLQRKFTALLFE
jgi:hypothetical protein